MVEQFHHRQGVGVKNSPLVEIKLRLGVTQERLAEAMGVNLDRVKSLMGGKAQHLRPPEIAGLVNEFHLNPDYFLNPEEPMFGSGSRPDEPDAAHAQAARVSDLVDLLPFDAGSRSRIKAAMRGDSAEDLKTLAQALAGRHPSAAEARPGYSINTWSEFVQVPRYDIRASAGAGALVDQENVLDYMAFRVDWLHNVLGLNAKRLALIDVDGDSMAPTLTHGDMILVDTAEGNGVRDGIHVINLCGRLLVKRLRPRLDRSIEVISDNVHYGSELVPATQLEQLKVVGRVVWQGRRV